MARLIEAALPLGTLREAARLERQRALGPSHSASLHPWWGRATISTLRAVLLASLLEEGESSMDLVRRSAGGEAVRPPTSVGVVDPFSGAGEVALATLSLGLACEARDANEVAALLTETASGIPLRFSGAKPVHPGEPGQGSYRGAEGLAEDVRYYGARLEEAALSQLGELYPQGREPLAWLWVRTVRCANPACGKEMPLVAPLLLRRAGSKSCWAEPVPSEELSFVLREGRLERHAAGGHHCPFCGELTTEAYLHQAAEAGAMGERLVAVVTGSGKEKNFSLPDAEELRAAACAPVEGLAEEMNGSIFPRSGFGFRRFRDIFSPRELRMLTVFSELVREAAHMAASAALARGRSEFGGGLAAGGTGALAYGEAVGVYLALAVDRLAMYHTTMGAWRPEKGTMRSAFGRKGIPMVWSYAEGNPFSTVSGNFSGSVRRVAAALASIEFAPKGESGAGRLICTRLPRYGVPGYAAYADFFYVWLKRSLGESYPGLWAGELATKSALSGKDCTPEEYRRERRTAIAKLYAASCEELPTLVFYELGAEELAESQEELGTLADDLLEAGFSVRALWPLEPLLLVLGKDAKGAATTRRGFVSLLRRELAGCRAFIGEQAETLGDARCLAIGTGLALFSRGAVLNADGSRLGAAEAIGLALSELEPFGEIKEDDDGAGKL